MDKSQFLAKMQWMEAAAKRAKLKLPPLRDLPESSSELIYWERYLNQLDELVAQSGCWHIGLRLGQEVHYPEMGPHGYVLTNAAGSIEQLLEILSRHSQSEYSVSNFHFKRLKRLGRLQYLPVEFYAPCHVIVDVVFSATIQLLRSHLGARWQPLRVSLKQSQPENLAPYHECLGPNVRFGEGSDFIEIGAVELATTINSHDQLFQGAMRDYARRLIESASRNAADTAAQVRLLLLNNMGNTGVSQEGIASALNISRATLQRRLEAESTSYREIRNDVFLQQARTFLAESNTPIASISDRLGYSEPAAFSRAFSGLVGVTPGAYRRAKHAG